MNQSSNERNNSIIAISSILVTLVVAITSPLLTTYLNNKSWESQKEKEQSYFYLQKQLDHEILILNKRVELIDKTSQLLGKSAGHRDIWRNYKEEIINPDPILAEKLADANAQYYSVMSMNQIYFGPKTREAINQLSKEDTTWWEKSKSKTDVLLQSMFEELSIGLSDNLK